MLTFALEPVSQCWPEVVELAAIHWAGTKSYRRHEPFKPSYERYRQYNEIGYFRLITARDGARLAGYFGVYLTNSMHSQKPMATEDTFFLHPDYRGGRTALRFLKHIERQCREWGVHELMFSCEIDNETGIQGLLKLLDFRPVIVQYSKRLVIPSEADSLTTRVVEASDVGPTPKTL